VLTVRTDPICPFGFGRAPTELQPMRSQLTVCGAVLRRGRVALLVSCALVMSACGRCGWGTHYVRGIRGYSGDGVISNVSVPSGLFGARGYIIDFPKFDLGHRYEATYHFSGVPTLGRAKAEIVLMIEDPRGYKAFEVDQLKDAAKGTLKCSLIDSSARVVTEFACPLKDLTWSSPIYGRLGYALYDYELDKSFFQPDSTEKYTLAVEYSGDETLGGKTGWIYVWCGCGGS
jgi:hypothetical protein